MCLAAKFDPFYLLLLLTVSPLVPKMHVFKAISNFNTKEQFYFPTG